MTFRSPPAHRHGRGSRGGASQFERDQRDLQRLVQRLGYDKLPINDETLRPFLAFLWGFGEARGHMVFVFDIPDGTSPNRLYYGLVGPAIKLLKIKHDMTEALQRSPLWDDITRAHPVFQFGAQCVLFFEGVWTPKEALPTRRH